MSSSRVGKSRTPFGNPSSPCMPPSCTARFAAGARGLRGPRFIEGWARHLRDMFGHRRHARNVGVGVSAAPPHRNTQPRPRVRSGAAAERSLARLRSSSVCFLSERASSRVTPRAPCVAADATSPVVRSLKSSAFIGFMLGPGAAIARVCPERIPVRETGAVLPSWPHRPPLSSLPVVARRHSGCCSAGGILFVIGIGGSGALVGAYTGAITRSAVGHVQTTG